MEREIYTVYIPRGRGAELIDHLNSGEWTAKRFREVGEYSVSVYRNYLQVLYETGDMEPVEQLKDTYVLTNVHVYSEKTGLFVQV